nr:G-protein coupled receptor moody-like isoform X1 [Procambarus clarkii]XP_045600320.1 G-protein coupled receptor moody-like isoform X1 [Procambarus clarkii]XP_045600328.1 G-protein coupled receptor moody-like isoform X1 [Procambarus clarkii]
MDFTSTSMALDPEGVASYTASSLESAISSTRVSGSGLTDMAVLTNLTAAVAALASTTSTPWEDTTIEGGQAGGGHSTPKYPYNMLGFTAASAFIISILGTFGNLLTIIALPLSKKLRTTATAFVVNLAVVELLFCVFILPMSGAQYLYLQQTNDSLLTNRDCVFFTSVRYTLTQVELQTILAIAFTRALAVSVPKLYTAINRPTIMGCYIAGIWMYSLFLKLPPALGLVGEYGFNEDTMECDMTKGSIKARYFYIVVEAVIPVLLIFILYTFVFIMVVRRALIRQRKFSQNFPPPPQPPPQVKLSSARVARAASRSKSKVVSPQSSIASTSTTSTSAGQRKDSNSSFRSLKRLVSESNLRSRFLHAARLLNGKSTHQSSNVSQRLTTNRRDMRVARTIFIIFLLVLVCSVPVACVHAIDTKVKFPVRFLLLHVLYWVQYCLNVVVYVFMNRQYRDAYVECLARVFPRFKAHHGRRFFWEKASVSSKPQPNYTSSKPVNQFDSSASEADPAAVVPQGAAIQGRLTAIPEGHSSSAANDSVFSDPQKKAQENSSKEELKRNKIHEDGEGSVDSEESDGDYDDVNNGIDEEQVLMDREHWVTKNGSTASSLPDDEAKL